MAFRLSFSTLELLNTCERKLQLEKLCTPEGKEESEHFVFGTAYGAGVASYLQHKDADRALFAAWLAYWPKWETESKSEARCLLGLQASFQALDTLLQDYDLAYTADGKPACELSFRMNIDEEYYYVGYIDAVLLHKRTGRYVVFEVKTTGLTLKDLSPLYKHSGQALGYSITLDSIVGQRQSTYGVVYFVLQLGRAFTEFNVHTLPFNKTLLDRLNWFIVLGLDVKHLKEMAELRVYPRRHSACVKFNKPCYHFQTCHLHEADVPAPSLPDTVEYQFVYELEDIVEEHLQRIAAANETALPCLPEASVISAVSSLSLVGMDDLDLADVQAYAERKASKEPVVLEVDLDATIDQILGDAPPPSVKPKTSLKDLLAAKRK